MTTDFTPTGTPLVNGMVDPQHPWVLWITRPDGKVEAVRGIAGRRAQYTRAFRNGDRDLMARCLAWGAENGFSAEEIAGDNPIPPEV